MFQATPDQEVRAWTQLESHRYPQRRPLLPFVAAIAATGAIAVVAAAFVGRHGPRPVAVPSPTATVHRPIEPPPPVLVALPAALPAGTSVLPGGLRARLQAGGRATWFPGTPPAGGHLVLERGTLEIDAASPVDVRVAALRVGGSAGRFEIRTRGGDDVDVAVKTGEAAVWSSVRLVKRVVAGERWSAPDVADTPASGPRAPVRGASARGQRGDAPAAAPAVLPDAPAPEARDCLRLARDGVTDDAIACFEGQVTHPGLTGEIALLELARIRRDVKGDLAGAERLLAEHRRRFPRSALAAEARTIHVELLLRLGHPAEALAEAERLTGTEALFWRAACLANLGRGDEAKRAFDDYLRHDGIERRGEAMRKRAELEGR